MSQKLEEITERQKTLSPRSRSPSKKTSPTDVPPPEQKIRTKSPRTRENLEAKIGAGKISEVAPPRRTILKEEEKGIKQPQRGTPRKTQYRERSFVPLSSPLFPPLENKQQLVVKERARGTNTSGTISSPGYNVEPRRLETGNEDNDLDDGTPNQLGSINQVVGNESGTIAVNIASNKLAPEIYDINACCRARGTITITERIPLPYYRTLGKSEQEVTAADAPYFSYTQYDLFRLENNLRPYVRELGLEGQNCELHFNLGEDEGVMRVFAAVFSGNNIVPLSEAALENLTSLAATYAREDYNLLIDGRVPLPTVEEHTNVAYLPISWVNSMLQFLRIDPIYRPEITYENGYAKLFIIQDEDADFALEYDAIYRMAIEQLRQMYAQGCIRCDDAAFITDWQLAEYSAPDGRRIPGVYYPDWKNKYFAVKPVDFLLQALLQKHLHPGETWIRYDLNPLGESLGKRHIVARVLGEQKEAQQTANPEVERGREESRGIVATNTRENRVPFYFLDTEVVYKVKDLDEALKISDKIQHVLSRAPSSVVVVVLPQDGLGEKILAIEERIPPHSMVLYRDAVQPSNMFTVSFTPI